MPPRLRSLHVGLFAAVGLVPAHRSANAQPGLTFSRDVAPIVWSRCATCHRPGQVGPFSLVTYAEVKKHTSQIARVTARRIMPPWKPVTGKGDFESARRLTDGELTIIQQWIAQGAVEGDRADLKPLPIWTDASPLGAPDLVVAMSEAYRLRADGPDVFRTFVLPIPTTRVQHVRALEVRPDNVRVVHHANIGIDRTRSSRRLDARDPAPGYAGDMVQAARYPEGQLLGWTPGQVPHAVPEGMQWQLDPGSDLVVQLHLQPTGRVEPLTVAVAFYFTDQPRSRTPIGLRLGSETIDIAAGDREYVVSDRYTLPADVEVLAIQPHAHNLARRMEATATRPDGGTEWLIAIDDWDFRWQDVYRYTRPLSLPKGTTIAMRYTYDNSPENPRNPRVPPGRVVWGQNTTDEMGDLWIQLVPRANADFAALNADVQRKRNVEDLAAYMKLLERDPTNPLRHDAVASIHLEAGRWGEAVAHLRQSVVLDPGAAPAHYNLGYALALEGRRDEAARELREALTIDPDYAEAHHNLGAVLHTMGRVGEALEHYRRAVALRPDNVEARANLGLLLSTVGRLSDAITEFRAALSLEGDNPVALSGLAWIRATSWDPRQRDGDEAVTLAERAAAATGRRDLSALDALAAAYAEVGRFDEAAAVAEAAADQSVSAGMNDVAARFRDRLALYRQGAPYRVPGPR